MARSPFAPFFSSFDENWVPLDGEDGPIPAYLRSVPAEIRGQIKEAVRRAYLDGEDDEPHSYTATTWVVTGTRPGAV